VDLYPVTFHSTLCHCDVCCPSVAVLYQSKLILDHLIKASHLSAFNYGKGVNKDTSTGIVASSTGNWCCLNQAVSIDRITFTALVGSNNAEQRGKMEGTVHEVGLTAKDHSTTIDLHYFCSFFHDFATALPWIESM